MFILGNRVLYTKKQYKELIVYDSHKFIGRTKKVCFIADVVYYELGFYIWRNDEIYCFAFGAKFDGVFHRNGNVLLYNGWVKVNMPPGHISTERLMRGEPFIKPGTSESYCPYTGKFLSEIPFRLIYDDLATPGLKSDTRFNYKLFMHYNYPRDIQFIMIALLYLQKKNKKYLCKPIVIKIFKLCI